jgi:hypothetical protein
MEHIFPDFALDTNSIYRETEVEVDEDIIELVTRSISNTSNVWPIYSLHRFKNQVGKLNKLEVTSMILEEI